MGEWMDGWMNGEMNALIFGRITERIDGLRTDA